MCVVRLRSFIHLFRIQKSKSGNPAFGCGTSPIVTPLFKQFLLITRYSVQLILSALSRCHCSVIMTMKQQNTLRSKYSSSSCNSSCRCAPLLQQRNRLASSAADITVALWTCTAVCSADSHTVRIRYINRISFNFLVTWCFRKKQSVTEFKNTSVTAAKLLISFILSYQIIRTLFIVLLLLQSRL